MVRSWKVGHEIPGGPKVVFKGRPIWYLVPYNDQSTPPATGKEDSRGDPEPIRRDGITAVPLTTVNSWLRIQASFKALSRSTDTSNHVQISQVALLLHDAR